MPKNTFWNIELPEGESKEKTRELSRNALILSGFTITSFAFLFALSKEQHLIDLINIQLLFFCLVLYFICSELARNARYFCEYAFAEISYIVASFVLFLDLTMIVFMMQLGLAVTIAIYLLLAYLLFSLCYSLYLIVVQIIQSIKK